MRRRRWPGKCSKIKISSDPACHMLSYTKLSGNVKRFKTLMGMSLQEFGLLFAKVEKAHPGAERERLSKGPTGAQSGQGAGSRLAGHKVPSFFKRNVFQTGHGNDGSLWPATKRT